MPISDDLKQNNEKILNGKNIIKNSIIEKGGEVPQKGTIPTFEELIQGIDSISGGTGPSVVGNGSIEIEATALENLKKGDSVKVINNFGTGKFVGEQLPLTYMIGETENTFRYKTQQYTTSYSSSKSPESYYPMYISRDGNFLVIMGYDGAIPYLKINNEWYQLKIDGEYKRLNKVYSIINGSYWWSQNNQNMDYDEINDIFYTAYSYEVSVYKVDRENLNLILKISKNPTNAKYPIKSLLVYDNNIFILYNHNTNYSYNRTLGSFKYDEKNNSFTVLMAPYYSTSDSGPTTFSNILILSKDTIVLNAVPDNGSSVYVRSFIYSKNEFGIYAFTKILNLVNVHKYSYTAAQYVINNNHETILYINGTSLNAGKYTLNNYNFTYNTIDISDIISSDESIIDINKLSNIYGTNNGRYLFLETSDTTIESTKRVCLFEYNFETKKYEFVCHPAENFEPAVMPISTTGNDYGMPRTIKSSLVFENNIIYQTPDNLLYQYRPVDKYTVKKNSGTINEAEDIYGYGTIISDVDKNNKVKVQLNVVNII